jgi:hypothetical protein
MYRISVKVRLYSPTPIVRVTLDDKGKEVEEIVCICQGNKKAGDIMSVQIVNFLNALTNTI